MDKIAAYNRLRWNELVAADIEYSRPFLNWDHAQALAWLRENRPFASAAAADIRGKDVLCLANGGGQQSAVFALLDARVTVFDLSEAQLEKDTLAAEHYQKTITIEQGDMRDLSRFALDAFDIVYHEYSINFVPDARQVLDGVARIIRPGGIYYLCFANPFWTMEEADWTEKGYPIRQTYRSGQELQVTDSAWDVIDRHGQTQKVAGPHEFLHTLSDVFNGLIANGFVIGSLQEVPQGDPAAKPGTWEHLNSIVPPFLRVGARWRPDCLREND